MWILTKARCSAFPRHVVVVVVAGRVRDEAKTKVRLVMGGPGDGCTRCCLPRQSGVCWGGEVVHTAHKLNARKEAIRNDSPKNRSQMPQADFAEFNDDCLLGLLVFARLREHHWLSMTSQTTLPNDIPPNNTV